MSTSLAANRRPGIEASICFPKDRARRLLVVLLKETISPVLLVIGMFAALSCTPFASGAAAVSSGRNSPCMQDAAYRRLDFWLGEWNVVDASGATVGSAAITRVLGGCAVRYEWRDPDGSETLEIFYYVPSEKEWHQVLISDSGRTMERTSIETMSNLDSLRFEGTGKRRDGTSYTERSTVTNVNNRAVHQLIERSVGGGDWKVAFEGEYKRNP